VDPLSLTSSSPVVEAPRLGFGFRYSVHGYGKCTGRASHLLSCLAQVVHRNTRVTPSSRVWHMSSIAIHALHRQVGSGTGRPSQYTRYIVKLGLAQVVHRNTRVTSSSWVWHRSSIAIHALHRQVGSGTGHPSQYTRCIVKLGLAQVVHRNTRVTSSSWPTRHKHGPPIALQLDFVHYLN
jgi:hypothetical protein